MFSLFPFLHCGIVGQRAEDHYIRQVLRLYIYVERYTCTLSSYSSRCFMFIGTGVWHFGAKRFNAAISIIATCVSAYGRSGVRLAETIASP